MSIPARSESEQIERLKRELEWAHMKIRVLEERLRLQRIRKYGPKSEKLSDAQLELLEGEPGVSTAEVEAESQREPLPAVRLSCESAGKPGKVRRHPGRQQLPAICRVLSRWSAARRNSACASNAEKRRRSSATSRASNSMSSRRATSWW